MNGEKPEVAEGNGRMYVAEDGGSVFERRFTVQYSGREAHQVTVEVSESGTPQHESCDCTGYRYRHDCRHIQAVYKAGVLVLQVE